MFATFAAYSTIKVLFIWICKSTVKNKPKKQGIQTKLAGRVFNYKSKFSKSRSWTVDSDGFGACITKFPAATLNNNNFGEPLMRIHKNEICINL